MERGLKGEDAAKLTADPSRDAYGLTELFQENGARGIQCLLVGDAVTVACKRLLLKTWAEECGEKEWWRRGHSASKQSIDTFKICVQYFPVIAVSMEPLTEAGEEDGKESACFQEAKHMSSRSQEEEFLNLFVEPCRCSP